MKLSCVDATGAWSIIHLGLPMTTAHIGCRFFTSLLLARLWKWDMPGNQEATGAKKKSKKRCLKYRWQLPATADGRSFTFTSAFCEWIWWIYGGKWELPWGGFVCLNFLFKEWQHSHCSSSFYLLIGSPLSVKQCWGHEVGDAVKMMGTSFQSVLFCCPVSLADGYQSVSMTLQDEWQLTGLISPSLHWENGKEEEEWMIQPAESGEWWEDGRSQ